MNKYSVDSESTSVSFIHVNNMNGYPQIDMSGDFSFYLFFVTGLLFGLLAFSSHRFIEFGEWLCRRKQ